MEFAKIYRRLYTSSLMELDLTTRWLFVYLCVFADKSGWVDQTDKAIAAMSGLTLEATKRALSKLSAPDELSRCQDFGGRRIIRPRSRAYGWHVVNSRYYRDLKDTSDLAPSEEEVMSEGVERTSGEITDPSVSDNCHGALKLSAYGNDSIASPCEPQPVSDSGRPSRGRARGRARAPRERDREGEYMMATCAASDPRVDGPSDPRPAGVIEVLDHLRSVTGSDYRSHHSGRMTSPMRTIAARLKDGHSPQDLIRVIDLKWNEWKGSELERFVRVKTLFGPKNFEEYLVQANRTKPAERQAESAWDRQNRLAATYQRLVREYTAKGVPQEEAEDRAAAEVKAIEQDPTR